MNKTVIVFLLFLMTTYVWGENDNVIPEVNLNLKKISATAKGETISQQTTHYSREEIEQSPQVTPLTFLNQQQSIVRLVTPSGDAAQVALSIRGFGENAAANSLILVDGFPLINPSLLAPNLNSILLSDIERFAIFQGSQGTLWGNQAVGGVVNIITRHPKAYFMESDIALGTQQRRFLSFLIGNKFHNGFYIKSFLLGNQNAHFRTHNQQSGWNAAATFGLDYANGTVSLNVQKYEDRFNQPGGLTWQQYTHDPQQASDYKNYTHFNTDVLQLLNRQIFFNEWLSETRLQHLNTNGDGIFTWRFKRLDQSNLLSERIYGNIRNVRLLIGTDLMNSRFEMNNTKTVADVSMQQKDVYAQLVSSLSNNVDLTLGLRFAHQHDKHVNNASIGNRVLVSTQGIAINPRTDISFYLRRDGNFRFPKANEVLFIPIGKDQLNVQTGVSYEAGLIWFFKNLITELNLYELVLDDEIAFNPIPCGTQTFGSFYNFDKTIRKGWTLLETYQALTNLKISAQINYVNPRFASGAVRGKLIPAVPQLTGNLGILYQINPQWFIQYFSRYTGPRYTSNDVQNLSKRLGGYWLHDLNFQYLKNAMQLTFELINLFNRIYPVSAALSASKDEITYYPGDGRSLLLTMKVNIE